VKDAPLKENNTFSSVGDPHETTGDGLKFDNQKTGNFDLLRSASGDLLVQNEQGPDQSGRWPGATLNHKVAVKDGNDVVKYDGVGKTMDINGKQVPVPKNGETVQLPGGGSVVGTADGFKVMTHKHDEIDVHQRDGYIDITGTLGDRMGSEVRGALGAFDADNDQSNDLKGRTGDGIIGKPGDKGAIDKFEEAWRAQPGENLFATQPGGGATQPGGGGAPTQDPGKLRAAINAMDSAGVAHQRAARAAFANGDLATAQKELAAAEADFKREADLIKMLQETQGAQAQPPAGGLPRPVPAPAPVHRRRIHKHHHRGFFHKLGHFVGKVVHTALKVPGPIFMPFAPIAAPIMVAKAGIDAAKGFTEAV
jgi:hypothetical protein